MSYGRSYPGHTALMPNLDNRERWERTLGEICGILLPSKTPDAHWRTPAQVLARAVYDAHGADALEALWRLGGRNALAGVVEEYVRTHGVQRKDTIR